MKARVFIFVLEILALWITAALSQSQSGDSYVFDAAQSSIEIGVFSGGALRLFGHDHTISARRFTGTIKYDAARLERSSVSVTIDSKSLTVLDPNVSDKDRHEVQATMEGPRVLNVTVFPDIAFQSTGLTELKQAGQEWKGTLAGNLKLHGVERPVTFPIQIRIENGRVRAQGEVLVSQREFGMTPISLAAGTVRVKDRVKITFSIMAERKRS